MEDKRKLSLGKVIWDFIYYFIIINFVASLCTLLSMSMLKFFAFGVTFGLIILGYYIRRKSITASVVVMNTIILLAEVILFTVVVVNADGSLIGKSFDFFLKINIPSFCPFYLFLIADNGELDLASILFVIMFVELIVSMCFYKSVVLKKWMLAVYVAAICCMFTIAGAFYRNRPEIRYNGHGFEYMNGYSSTDLSDYMVYSEPSKLATLDTEASVIIKGKDNMPVMDGAEACYPLYAAIAKAIYKDIDVIEKKGIEETVNKYQNGEIVQFTNTVRAFEKLINRNADIVFGARPSKRQLDNAANRKVQLEVTPIGKEAFVFFVEADNPVNNLTSEQVRAIYHGDITNWSEVGGKNQEIIAFQRPKDSGSQTMMEYFMGDVTLKEPMTYETVQPMSGVIENVAQYNNEEGAFGYTFRYFLEELNQEKNVKILSIDGVEPTLDNIKNGSYPLVVDVCAITRGYRDPNVQKVIDFILSDEGQYIIEKTGYAPIK